MRRNIILGLVLTLLSTSSLALASEPEKLEGQKESSPALVSVEIAPSNQLEEGEANEISDEDLDLMDLEEGSQENSEDIESQLSFQDDNEKISDEDSLEKSNHLKEPSLELDSSKEELEEVYFSKEERIDKEIKADLPTQRGWNTDKTRYSLDGKTYVVGRVYIDKNYYLFNEAGYLVKNAFVVIKNTVYYGDTSGKPVTGFQRIYGKLYYFNPTYHMMLSHGIANIYGVDYLFRKDGSILEGKGWVKDEGHTYYLSSKGVLRGRQVLGSHTYWFEANGTIKKSGFVSENNYDYYVKDGGILASGFTRIEGKLYYFNPSYFFMLKGGMADIRGQRYFFRADGSIIEDKGWFKEGQTTYYRRENGDLASGFMRIEGKLYYFNPVYHFRLEDGLAIIHGYRYLFRKDGSILEGKGWVRENGHHYYLSHKGVVTGKQKIDGRSYGFNEGGELQKSTWFKQGNTTYYALSDGRLASGFNRIEGKLYYFNPVYHFRLENGLAQIRGYRYLFRKDGSILEGKGLVKEGDNTYFIDGNGIRSGLVEIDGRQYFFDKDGIYRDFGFYKSKNLTYFLLNDGQLASGWLNHEGKRYYFNPVHHFMLAGGQASIYGKHYYFDLDGAVVFGWHRRGDNHYYYHRSEGYQYRNGSFRVDGFLRLFNESGHLIEKEGLVQVNGKTYFIDSRGEVKVNQRIDYQGKKYILGEDGVAIVDSYMMNVKHLSQRPWLPTGCEITAVTMMLSTKAGALDLISMANEMPRSYNPYLGYVGNPFTTAGWTIYPEALEGMVRKYTGSYKNLTGADNEAIKSQLMIDRPVVAWVTLHGFTVHAITIVGFSPDGFYYHDPWTGEAGVFMSYGQFNHLNGLHQRKLLSY